MEMQGKMGCLVKTIKSPFRKARTLLNPHKEKKTQQDVVECESPGVNLHGEVMACTYEDVRVMWSILDKSRPNVCNSTS